MNTGRVLLVAALTAFLLAVAGCGGTPAPTAGPTPTITPAVMMPSGVLVSAGTPVAAASTAAPTMAASAPTQTGTALPALPLATGTRGALPSVPILMYHQIRDLPTGASANDIEWTVSPAALDAQLGYLAQNGYVTISLDTLLDGYAGRVPLPAKPVVITFDDGWRTQYTIALPLLKKYRQTATFYVVTTYHVGYGGYFSWEMTGEVQKAGMTIASHTVDHTALPGLSASAMERQLKDSKSTLETKLGISVTHLAYPYGAYSDAVVAAAKRLGYRSATTINPTVVKPPLSPYLLPRVHATYKDVLANFIKKLQ